MLSNFVTILGNRGYKHHEQTKSTQTAFVNNLNNMISVIDELGNPFKDDSFDILSIYSKFVMMPPLQLFYQHKVKAGRTTNNTLQTG